MKKLVLLSVLVLWGAAATAQLAKERLFKVDPLSLVFKELRVAVEHRVYKDYFLYLGPYGYHQFWRSRSEERYNRPTFPQKYYGVGLRAGARRYFLPKGESPHGFFVQGHFGMRQLWIHNYDDDLQLVDRSRLLQGMFGGTVGYQWITGPRKDFCYGFIGGFEKYFYIADHSSTGLYGKDAVTANWYEFPFLLDGKTGLRFYLGIEVGFAFLQKHLHW